MRPGVKHCDRDSILFLLLVPVPSALTSCSGCLPATPVMSCKLHLIDAEFCFSSSSKQSSRLQFHWPVLGHLFIPEPITKASAIQGSENYRVGANPLTIWLKIGKGWPSPHPKRSQDSMTKEGKREVGKHKQQLLSNWILSLTHAGG